MHQEMDHLWHFRVEGDARPESQSPAVKSIRFASPDYFRTLGIPLLAGRVFLDSDTADAPQVVVINRSLARQGWGSADPVGRRISLDAGKDWARIVGVVGDTREFGLTDEAPLQLYLAHAQSPNPGSILVRTAGDPSTVTNLVRRAILGVDPENAITRADTLEQVREDSVSSPRTTTRMFSLFAVLAFLIALAGIGSMLALWVKQRTREIGIRMAMGARPRQILGLVIRQGMLLVAIGLVAGYVGAVALAGFLKTFLFQVEPTDGATYAAVSALLLGAALIACYLPAMRAAQIDPQVALRCD
jgi:putative ABC transport system permease protein